MGYTWNFDVIWTYRVAFILGAKVTLEISLLSIGLGLVLGLLLGLGRMSTRSFLKYPSLCFIEFFRTTPVLVQLIWFYYVLPIVTGLTLSNFVAGLLALGFSASAFLAEIYRAGIQSVDKGQMDSALSVGMTYSKAMRRIILPQALRRMVPPMVNQFAMTIKFSALTSVIAVYELLYQGNNIIQTTFRPLEVYTCVAIFYFVLIYPIIMASRKLETSWGIS